ncbi:MAG TPA: trigger factor [Roseiflexaceae bacterium]|nr:trigger factor [Roseiflexaceae bacterium]
MKVTTEKLPRSLLALTIELEREQVEKGLDRAARRLSQKYAIPGFRKGKAPRFIVENYFGRPALLDEATDDLINRSFREALEQEKIEPIGQPALDRVQFDTEPFQFVVNIPVEPTVTLPDYRAIRAAVEIDDVNDEDLEQAMKARLDRHAVLRDLEEPRPAQEGDQLEVELEAFVDGQPVDERDPDEPLRPTTLVLEPNRLAAGLFEGLVGQSIDQALLILSHMPEDHPNEKVAGKEVSFAARILKIQERLLPDWEELPTLEEFDGTLDELRTKTQQELLQAARQNAEQKAVNSYIEQLVAQTQFDIPDVLVEREADRMLQERESEYSRYGVKPEQVYEMQGVKREDLLANLKPEAEQRLLNTLALGELVRAEELRVEVDEITAALNTILKEYDAEQRERLRTLLGEQLAVTAGNQALDRKLRRRILEIASDGSYTPLEEPEASDEASAASDHDAAGVEEEEAAAETIAEEEAATEEAADTATDAASDERPA